MLGYGMVTFGTDRVGLEMMARRLGYEKDADGFMNISTGVK
jgi:hypothetical protein